MVDVYDRVTGRGDERAALETRVAELGVEDATHKVEGVAADFELREEVLLANRIYFGFLVNCDCHRQLTRKRMELAAVRHAVQMRRLAAIRKKIRGLKTTIRRR